MTNIVKAIFGAMRTAQTRKLHQWDYGQILQFIGPELPGTYTVHFANDPVKGEAKTQIGDATGVVIPDEYLTTGATVYAWVYLHTGADDGETVYTAVIPVIPRPRPTEDEPTPEQRGLIDTAIAAINAAVEQTGEDVEAAAQSAEAAQAAQEAAETASGTATGAARQAAQSADGASGSAGAAAASASAAATSAEAAAGNAQSAEESADRAEQAAADAGYMYFSIDERGHLIYQRTSNTEVDFYLDNGHLYVKGIA